jgi:plastocyanin
MNRKVILLTSVLVLALALSACSASPAATMATQPPANPPAAATDAVAPAGNAVAVEISGYAFNPPTLTVKEGTTVTWTNSDSVVHTVTSDTGLFDSGDMAQGATFSFTFTTAGTYVYHCLPHHAKMEGTIVVTK